LIEIGIKLVEKEMNWNLGCYSTGHQSTASTENFTHPDDEFDQY
jgi:hypothetical protein